MDSLIVDNRAIALKGRLFRIASVQDEPYVALENPKNFLLRFKDSGIRADAFTFLQAISDRESNHGFVREPNFFAVLTITTFENWWKKQLNDKTRNMVRKAQKAGVEIRVVELNDDLVTGIMGIYNESAIVQGKPNRHYGKDFATVKQGLVSFPGCSEFLGAYHQDKLIGFVKLVHGKNVASLLHIQSLVEHRAKAPTNALIAKVVEICAERRIPYLHYGVWSRRGLGDFKKHHGFEQFDVPRYFVALNLKGRLMLALRLHRGLHEIVPDGWKDRIVGLRNRWNTFMYKRSKG